MKLEGHVGAMVEGAKISIKLQIQKEFTKSAIKASLFSRCLSGMVATYE